MSGTAGAVDSVNDDRQDKNAVDVGDGVRLLVADVTLKIDDGKKTHWVGSLEWDRNSEQFLFNPNNGWCWAPHELEALAKVLRTVKRDVTPSEAAGS